MVDVSTDVSAARVKLREARFFLDRLRSRVKVFPLDPEEVACLSSAFLSAARSVTFALRLGSPDLYDAWLPVWLAGLGDEERALCRTMVACPECDPLEAGVALASELIPLTETRSDRWGHPAYSFHWFHPNGADEQSPIPAAFYLGGPVTEICRNCERFVLLLERLVADYSRSGGNPEALSPVPAMVMAQAGAAEDQPGTLGLGASV